MTTEHNKRVVGGGMNLPTEVHSFYAVPFPESSTVIKPNVEHTRIYRRYQKNPDISIRKGVQNQSKIM